MHIDFGGKTIAITGGANGIGSACARLFASSGGEVWVLDHEHPGAHTGARTIQADVSDAAEVERALDQVIDAAGRLDVVAINAGTVRFAPLL